MNGQVATISQLPLRAKGSYENNFKKVSMLSNHFKVEVEGLNSVFLYKVEFEPKIEETDRLKRNAIYCECNTTISKFIQDPVFSGSIIFTAKKPDWGDTKDIAVTFNQKEVLLKLRLVKAVNFSEGGNQQVQLNFLNNWLRTSMRKLNFIEIGRSKKFFDSGSKRIIPDLDMVVYQGYTANFCRLQKGLFLKVDSVTKFVRRQTVLQYINQLYQQNNDKDRDARRQIVADTLKGQTIMANYGKSNYWRIQNVIFGENIHNYQPIKESEKTLSQYYSQKYNLEIGVKGQPLLEAKLREETVVLIPQFCLMTGLPQNIDDRKRREISQASSKTTSERMDRLLKFRKKLDKELTETNPGVLKDKLGITIASELVQLGAKKIEYPQLQLGGGYSVQEGRQPNFKLYDKPIHDSTHPLECCVFHFVNFDISALKKLFQSTSRNIKLSLGMKIVNLGDFSAGRALDILSKEIKYQHGKGQFNIFLIVLPAPAKHIYKQLKKLCYCDLGILLQVCLDTIVKKRQFQSAATKVLLQMAAKTGNTLWVPRSKIIDDHKIMLIGINTSSEKNSSGKKRIAYCSSMNQEITRFYSNSQVQNAGTHIIEHMDTIVFNSIKAYSAHSNCLPSEIIVLRDGCSAGQIGSVIQFQVEASLKSIKEFGTPIKLTFIVIDKKPSQKFFQNFDGRFLNPSAGTLVNSGLVSNDHNFFLISQMVTRGTSIPTFYQVLYSDSKLQSGMIEEVVYSQCYNYSNWTGSIKIPSPVQYAKKLCEFLSVNLNDNQPINLERFPYYI